MMMKILLADDQPQVRSALRLLLEQESVWQVVGEAKDAAAMRDILFETSPDIVLLDWELPGFQAEKNIMEIKDLCPGTQVVAFSSKPGARENARKANVDAFISKGDPPKKVLETLNKIQINLYNSDGRERNESDL